MKKIIISKPAGTSGLITPAMKRAQAKESAPWKAPKQNGKSGCGGKATGCLVVFLVGFAAIFFMFIVYMRKPVPFEREMARSAKEAVAEHLLSPSSAIFNDRSMKWKELEYGKFVVSGSLEAKNAFGVLIANEFVVYIERSGDFAIVTGGVLGNKGWGIDNLGNSLLILD
jgi:hypothetical protein